MALAGEAGEVADKIAKVMRDNDGNIPQDVHDGIVKELGDVLWNIANLAKDIGVPLSVVAITNIQKVTDRQARGVVAGSGDDR